MLNQKILDTKLMDKVTVKFGTFTKSQVGMTNNIVVRQFGEVVTINGWVSNATLTANTATKIGEISNVTMPPEVIRTYCNVGGNAYQVGTLSYIGLGTNGEIGVTSSNGGSGKAIFFEMAYITGVDS